LLNRSKINPNSVKNHFGEIFYYVNFFQISILSKHRKNTFTEINDFDNNLSTEKCQINMTDRGHDKLCNQYKNSCSNGCYMYVTAINILSK
jgi:hypothetical protein